MKDGAVLINSSRAQCGLVKKSSALSMCTAKIANYEHEICCVDF